MPILFCAFRNGPLHANAVQVLLSVAEHYLTYASHLGLDRRLVYVGFSINVMEGPSQRKDLIWCNISNNGLYFYHLSIKMLFCVQLRLSSTRSRVRKLQNIEARTVMPTFRLLSHKAMNQANYKERYSTTLENFMPL